LLSTDPGPDLTDYPGWAFILNFRVTQGSNPAACLLIYMAPNIAPVPITVPCAVPNGGVTFSHGRARFDGGRIECPLNIRDIIWEVSGVVLSTSVTLNNLYMGGAGALDSLPGEGLHDNPILTYAPDDQSPGIGLFVPVSATVQASATPAASTPQAASGRIVSRFGDFDFDSAQMGAQTTFPVDPDRWQGWAVTYERVLLPRGMPPDTVTVTHYLESIPLGTLNTQGALNLHIDGGKFIIGDSIGLNSKALSGTLCGVLASGSRGGTRPPKMRKPIPCYDLFTPLARR
jgi:hypothetical protein